MSVKGYLFAAVLLTLLALPGQHAYAAIEVQLAPSPAGPQPVGTTVTWTASAGADAGTLHYQFSVQPNGGDFAVVRDFSVANSFQWTPAEHEGTYNVKVVARNVDTAETAQAVAVYSVSSRVVGNSPLVSGTAHPLVALYSAPACAGGSMRVRFWRTGDFSSKTTPWKLCRPGLSMNFYVAGMLAATQYSMRHEVSSDPAAPVAAGPTLSFTTGTPPATGLLLPAVSPLLAPPADSRQDVILHGYLNANFSATNLSGQLLWYYNRGIRGATQPVAGGTMLVLADSPNFNDTLREIDLAGNTVRETNIGAVTEQLLARGEQGITFFHHEARRLANGDTVVLCGNERVMSDVQGPGPVAIVGDMIVVLDKNLQVTWSWNGFEHMDVTRKALLDEKCTINGGGCFSTHSPANDWLHSNAVSYTPDGNFLVSMRHQDWVVKIDYRNGLGTGEVLWRLGKDGDFTINSSDPYPWFSHQHDAKFEFDTTQRLLVYDNGNMRRLFPNATGNSRGQVFLLDEANRTASLQLNADLGGFAAALGSAQKLDNGEYHFLSGFLQPGNHSQSIGVRPDGTINFILQSQGFTYRSFRMRDLYTPGDLKPENSQEAQTISFDAIAGKLFSDAPFTVNATASSGLPVEIRVVSGPATISGNTVTLTGAGTVTLQADQHGNIKYNEATSVRRSFVVKAQATLTLGNLSQTYDGTAKAATVTTNPAGLSGVTVGYSQNGAPVAAPVNAGTYQVLASLNNANHHAADVMGTLVIGKAQATLTLGGLSQTYDGAAKSVSVATNPAGLSGVTVSYSQNGVPVAAPTNAGAYQVVASLNNANYSPAQAAGTLVIGKASQAITFTAPADKRFGDAPFELSATSSSGLPVSFQVVLGPATVSGNMLSITGTGTVVVRASQAGDANHNAAPAADRFFTVAKGQATLTLGNLSQTYDGTAKAATVTTKPAGLSGVTVGYSQNGAPVAAPVNAGTYQVVASLNNANYQAADAAGTLVIGKASQTINFTAPPEKTFGDSPFNLSAAATSSLPVAFIVVSGPATVQGTAVTITGAGTVVIRASQAGNANFNPASDVEQFFTVARAQATLTLGGLSQTYDGAAKSVSVATSPAGLSGVTVSYSQNGAPVAAPTSAGTYQVVASLSNANYLPAEAAGTLVIGKAQATLTLGNLSQTYDGTARAATATSSPAGLAGITVSYTLNNAPVAAPTEAGTYQVIASLNNDNYQAADAAGTLVIGKAAQTISFATLPAKTFGDVPFELSATSSSGLPVTFAVVSGPAAVSGQTVSITGAGTVVIRASQTGGANHNAAPVVEQSFAVAKAVPLITWETPADIVVGTPLGGTHLNATANVPGTFTYNPPAGTVLPEGPGLVLFARFTPTDTANYAVARAQVAVNVVAVPLTLLTIENSERAWSLSSITELPGPFSVLDGNSFSADRHTRVMLFALNLDLLPGEDATAVTATAEDAQGRVFALPVEFVGKVPNHPYLTQVNVKLTDELSGAGDVRVSIKLREKQSNRALIGIKP